MGLFGNLNTAGHESVQDTLGGGNFGAIESGAYEAVIKVAYAGAAPSGAQNVTFVFTIPELGDREYRETIYITNKAGETFYLDKKNPNLKRTLPGYATVNDICIVTTGDPLTEQDTEEKVVKVYDFDANGEVNKSVQALTGLTGQKVILGLQKQLEDKKSKVGNEYVPTGETRETNVIDKIFHSPTKMTVNEAERELTEGEFYNDWLKANEGKVRDRTAKDKGNAGKPGAARSNAGGAAPQAGGGGDAPRKKLFG